mgnify:CR=1 FL=1
MSYTINLPNGALLTTILDGTVDNTASSLTLVGRNYANYGQIIATDLAALPLRTVRTERSNPTVASSNLAPPFRWGIRSAADRVGMKHRSKPALE